MSALDAPFEESELLGRFVWKASHTKALEIEPWLYIAMHEKRLRKGIRNGRIIPRGSFDVSVDGAVQTKPCTWGSLQSWHSYKFYNHFGPFVVSVPLRELDGRRFYVFERGKRGLTTWNRIYFVQREDTAAIFDEPAPRIDPLPLFKREPNGVLVPKDRVQYELVLTESISLAKAKVEATAHEVCYASCEKCREKLDRRDAIERLETILDVELMPPGARMFPRPFPLRRVIPPHKLPQLV